MRLRLIARSVLHILALPPVLTWAYNLNCCLVIPSGGVEYVFLSVSITVCSYCVCVCEWQILRGELYQKCVNHNDYRTEQKLSHNIRIQSSMLYWLWLWLPILDRCLYCVRSTLFIHIPIDHVSVYVPSKFHWNRSCLHFYHNKFMHG